MNIDLITKKNIFLIRLVVIITLGYLVIFDPSGSRNMIWCYLYLAVYLGTNLILGTIPNHYFRKSVYFLLVVFDSIMICIGIYLSGRAGTDFYLIYFLIIGIASMSIDLRYLMVNTFVFAGLYGWLLYQKNLFSGEGAVSYALRLPFIFVIAVFFGYMVNAVVKKRDRDIRESEEKFRSLVASMDDLVYVVDREAKYLSASDKVTTLLGVTENDIMGRPFSDFHTPEQSAEFSALVEQVYEREKGVQYESYDQRLDMWSLVNLSPIRNTAASGIRGVSVVSKNISERIRAEKRLKAAYDELKQTQDQLIQNEKMAAVGRLASSMAHQIRNPLEIILMGVEYIGNAVEPRTKEIDIGIGKVENAVRRTNKIINDILRFSKPSETKFENIDVSALLDETIELISHRLKKSSIVVEKECTGSAVGARADKILLEQVILNLITNAVDAMPGGGVLKVKAYDKNIAKADSTKGIGKDRHFKIGDKAAVVEIADNGTGIPEKLQSMIFEPFCTTKGNGNGTGLGLSLAHLIMERHKGSIDVESEVGRGTTFILQLQPSEN